MPFNVLFLLNFDVLLGFCLISQLSFLCSGIGSGLTMSASCSKILQARCPSCHASNGVKALKSTQSTDCRQGKSLTGIAGGGLA